MGPAQAITPGGLGARVGEGRFLAARPGARRIRCGPVAYGAAGNGEVC